MSCKSVFNVAKKYCTEGIASVLSVCRNKNSDTSRTKIDDDTGTHIVTMMCVPAPEGRSCWTTKLANNKTQQILTLDEDSKFSDSALWRYLNKIELKHHKSKY